MVMKYTFHEKVHNWDIFSAQFATLHLIALTTLNFVNVFAESEKLCEMNIFWVNRKEASKKLKNVPISAKLHNTY